ncbi:MAG: DM13 domain-containing protein [Cyclobacteriaceae bacterium]
MKAFIGLVALVLIGCVGTEVERFLPQNVRIDNFPTDLVEGHNFQLKAIYFDSVGNSSSPAFQWQSLTPEILSINTEGLIRGLQPGLGTIEVTYEGLNATVDVEVIKKLATEVSIQAAPQLVNLGETHQLRAVCFDQQGSTDAITFNWSSTNPDAINVNQTGEIRSLGEGSAWVIAVFDGISDSVNINVVTPEISIIGLPDKIDLGETVQMRFDYSDASGISNDIGATWSSSDETIVSVDPTGLLTALNPGEATISLNYENTSSSKTVSIIEPAIEIPNLPDTIGLSQVIVLAPTLKNSEGSFTDLEFVLTSSDPSVVAIENGELMAVGVGEALITVSFGSITHQILVRIEDSANLENTVSIEVFPEKINVTDKAQLTAAIRNNMGDAVEGEIIWSSSNESIVSVTTSGEITAHKSGEVMITATAGSKNDEVTINAIQPQIAITDYPKSIVMGNSAQLTAQFTDASGSSDDLSFAWSSSQSGIISISSAGVITAHASGSAIIQVSYMSLNDFVTINVLAPRVEFTNRPTMMAPASSFQASAVFIEANGTQSTPNFIWSSTNEDAISVDQTGLLLSGESGSATIKVEHNGFFDEAVVTIDATASGESRNGTLEGVSGYDISGDIRLYEMDGTVFLEITDPSIEGPGPFYYLSNQSNIVSGGYQVSESKAVTTSGAVTFELPSEINLNTYDYVIVWCMPFSVTLGRGQFD